MIHSLTSFFMRLTGKAQVHESAEEVRDAIARNSFDTFVDRAGTHAAGAARLTDSLALQPGLVELHDELHDIWAYLASLADRATELGDETLATHLGNASGATCNVLIHVALAAEATVPVPAVPLTR